MSLPHRVWRSWVAVDIILVETLKRLEAEHVDDVSIDATRTLPMRCAKIRDLEIERDLPPFVSTPQESGWEEPLPVDPDEEVRGRLDVEELWCPHAQCQSVGCTIHSELFASAICFALTGEKSMTREHTSYRLYRSHNPLTFPRLDLSIEHLHALTIAVYAMISIRRRTATLNGQTSSAPS